MKDTPSYDIHRNKSREIPGGKIVGRMMRTIFRLNIHPYKLTCGIKPSQLIDYCKKYSDKNVLLIGSNPGQKSPDNTAFHPDTKSRQFVDKWFEDETWCIGYENLVDFKTAKNKQLSNSQIEAEMPWIVKNINAYKDMGWSIVACGKIASRGLTMAGIEHFEMPHPSGLCRFWNDKEAGKAKIEEMKKWAINE